MKKEINKSIYESGNIIFEYDIPKEYKHTKPHYFTPAIELIEESVYLRYYEFPVVVSLLAYNENGELYDNKHIIVDWHLSNSFNYKFTPNLERDIKQHTHEFTEYFKAESFIKKSDCIKYVTDAKNLGFDNLKFSIGIWTNECILCEKIFDYNLGFEHLAKEYCDIEAKNKRIYYENPFLTKHCLEQIFVETAKIMSSDEFGSYELKQDLLNILFENKSNDKNSMNDVFNPDFKCLIENYLNIICVLDEHVDLLKTIAIIQLDDKIIEVSFNTYLSIMFHYKEDDFEFKLFNSDKSMCVKEIRNDNPSKFRFEITDRMIRLRNRFNNN